MASKTAQRILFTSLELFNIHGEAAVTSVDIAMELDISPGNLYYHFKGKEVLVSALFELFSEQMKPLLARPSQPLNLDEFLYALHLQLEVAATFRFLFRNPVDLLEKYPLLTKPFRHILNGQQARWRESLEYAIEQGQLSLSREAVSPMLHQLGLVFSQAANYALLKGENLDNDEFAQHCLRSIVFLLHPYNQTERHDWPSFLPG
ncbi:TetR/AcrR family transcriptional regulator [Bowmanella sp. Y26]|uniref:TetR/AcrR family transcriptional regulator n=1 Tax=Bowmanella yangjiangensis TaxID=2811230 RepID=UPI001BDC3324|nr:TetR/AcrR family transcriptional regulator [Bowmanella yangjiangensis]MBT1063043.1 TetR/AcrR family transcriptional regulator [Bowmanella yangjiangensis]